MGGRMSLRAFALVFALESVALAMPEAAGRTIYEAFDEKFSELLARVDELGVAGYSDVLVSPPQKNLPRPEWWARYQPVDYRSIEGPLGTRRELQDLVVRARQAGVRILIDTVLNHMANVDDYPDLDFPQFTAADFHFPDSRLCIRDFADRFQAVNHWLCDSRARLPDLDTASARVREIHVSYLRDALPLGPFSFGEVVGTSKAEVREYLPHMQVTDFWLLGAMLGAFLPHSDPAKLEPGRLFGAGVGPGQIAFARTHDALFHDGFYRFPDEASYVLANVYLLTIGDGDVLILNHDHEAAMAALRFRRGVRGLPVEFSSGTSLCSNCKSVGGWSRGEAGFVLVNLADRWVDLSDLRLPLDGCFQELRYGFFACFSRAGGVAVVRTWADGIPSIGPRTPLVFLRANVQT